MPGSVYGERIPCLREVCRYLTANRYGARRGAATGRVQRDFPVSDSHRAPAIPSTRGTRGTLIMPSAEVVHLPGAVAFSAAHT